MGISPGAIQYVVKQTVACPNHEIPRSSKRNELTTEMNLSALHSVKKGSLKNYRWCYDVYRTFWKRQNPRNENKKSRGSRFGYKHQCNTSHPCGSKYTHIYT